MQNRCELISKQISWNSGVKGIPPLSLLFASPTRLFLLQALVQVHSFFPPSCVYPESIYTPLLVSPLSQNLFIYIALTLTVSPSLIFFPGPFPLPLPLTPPEVMLLNAHYCIKRQALIISYQYHK